MMERYKDPTSFLIKSKIGNIEILIRDYKIGQGDLTIRHDGESWTHYWSSMGCELLNFISQSQPDYICTKLSPFLDHDRIAVDEVKNFLLNYIIKKRIDRELSRTEARDLFDSVSYLDFDRIEGNEDVIHDVIGGEWWYDLPREPNPDYVKLREIVSIVIEEVRNHIKCLDDRIPVS